VSAGLASISQLQAIDCDGAPPAGPLACSVTASTLPLSIIIIGIGGADFTNMGILDADDKVLVSPASGQRAQRDCVQVGIHHHDRGAGSPQSHTSPPTSPVLAQFVPFSQFASRHYSELAKATLAEVPSQVLAFFKSRNILPNAPVPPPTPTMPPPEAPMGVPAPDGSVPNPLSPGPMAPPAPGIQATVAPGTPGVVVPPSYHP
jgi:hypothetical protein